MKPRYNSQIVRKQLIVDSYLDIIIVFLYAAIFYNNIRNPLLSCPVLLLNGRWDSRLGFRIFQKSVRSEVPLRLIG